MTRPETSIVIRTFNEERDLPRLLEAIHEQRYKDFEVIETKGVKVFIEPSATMFLVGSEMDYKKDKLESRFVFNNPNEKNS